jgi:hypothetical protein
MFAERRFDDPGLAAGRAAVELVLKAHEPWPALAVDRHWTMVAHNAVVPTLITGCAAELLAPPVNVLRLSLHPGGLAPRIANLREWRAHLLSRLERQIATSGDAALEALHEELSRYPQPAADRVAAHGGGSDIVVPLVFDSGHRPADLHQHDDRVRHAERRAALRARARDLPARRRGDAGRVAQLPPRKPAQPPSATRVVATPSPAATHRAASGTGRSCRSSARRASGAPGQARTTATPRRRCRTHREMRERRGDPQAPREAPPPARFVVAQLRRLRLRLRCARRASHGRSASARGEHERRLDRHADALADDRMRLAGGVADAKEPVALPEPHAGTDRPGREPRAVAHGACEAAATPAHSRRRIASNTSPARSPGCASRSRPSRSSRMQPASVAMPPSATTMPP